MLNRAEELAGAAIIGLMLVILGAAAGHYITPHAAPEAIAAPDPIRAVGTTYAKQLLAADAAAWEAGAKLQDSSATLEASLQTVGTTWATSRTSVYQATVTPVLSRIVPEGTADADVTPAQHAAMAAAMRSIAKGVSP
jgi:hypothetical protein